MKTCCKKTLEKFAKRLHNWYLQATLTLNPTSYNKKAQREYEDLTEEQKEIDRFIARRIMLLLEKKDKQIKELKEDLNKFERFSDALMDDKNKLIEQLRAIKHKTLEEVKKEIESDCTIKKYPNRSYDDYTKGREAGYQWILKLITKKQEEEK